MSRRPAFTPCRNSQPIFTNHDHGGHCQKTLKVGKFSVSITPSLIKTACSAVYRYIQSLNPHRQGPADFCDLSNYVVPHITFISSNAPLQQHKSAPLTYFWSRKPNARYSTPTPFPPNSKGYLYYHSPPHLPPSAGELRFRLANIDTSFRDGKDLLTPHGIPWHIPVLSIARHPPIAGLQPIKRQLLAESLITREQLNECAEIPDVPQLSNETVILHELSQPFPISWSAGVMFWAISGNPLKARNVRMGKLFRDAREGKNGMWVCPFDGEFLCCALSVPCSVFIRPASLRVRQRPRSLRTIVSSRTAYFQRQNRRPPRSEFHRTSFYHGP